MEGYTTSDVTKVLEIPFGRLREWIVKGYIEPSVPSPGQGRPAEFSLEDVYRIETFRRMVDGGLSRDLAAEYVQFAFGGKLLVSGYLILRRSKGEIHGELVVGDYDDECWVLLLNTGKLGGLHEEKDDRGETRRVLGFIDKISPFDDWDDIYIVNLNQIRSSIQRKFNDFGIPLLSFEEVHFTKEPNYSES